MSTCAVPDCPRDTYARGHCEKHYRQLLRRGQLSPARLAARTCRAGTCERPSVTRGWCHAHYLRWVRTGDARPEEPLLGPGAPGCSVDGCPHRNHARGLCRTHLERLAVRGDVRADLPVPAPSGGGYVHGSGYLVVPVPPQLRHLTGGAASSLEHRLVMAVLLDRALVPDEVVHHRNGDRLDNRPDNLELWSTAQPKGQRVQDKVAWALEVLRRYDPGALAPERQAPTATDHSGCLSDDST